MKLGSVRFRALVRPAVLMPAIVAAALATGLPAIALQQSDVTITVVDEAGAPVKGVKIVLVALDTEEKPLAQAPLTAKTNARGVASFPFLPYNSQGGGRWDVMSGDPKLFVRQFKIESRQVTSQERGKGTLIQDNSGTLSPTQKIRAMIAKPGGTVAVNLTLAPTENYHAGAPAASVDGGAPAAGVAGGAAAEGAAGSEPEDPIGQARLLMAQSKYSEAEEKLTALKTTDDTAEVNFELARAYHLQEKGSEEKLALRAAIAKDPNYPRAHYALGRIAYDEGRSADAIKEFETEMKAHPDDTATASALASLYNEAGRTEDAVRAYEALLALEPSNMDTLVALDGLYTGLGNTEKSEETFKRILAQSPEGADQVYYRVGAKIQKQADLTEADRLRAIAAFSKAAQLNPKNAKAHHELGYLYLGAGKMDEAKKEFQAYLALEPNGKDAATIKSFLQGS